MQITHTVHARVLKPWRGRLPSIFSFYHVFSPPLSGFNWRSLTPLGGPGPFTSKMASLSTGSVHTPSPGFGTNTLHMLNVTPEGIVYLFNTLEFMQFRSDCLWSVNNCSDPQEFCLGFTQYNKKYKWSIEWQKNRKETVAPDFSFLHLFFWNPFRLRL